MKNVIYKLTSPSNKSYIGLTTNYKRRMKKHSKAIGNCKLQCAIRKYGWDNFKKEILEEVEDPKLLPKLEKFYIKFYHTFDSGYNMTLGGDGLIGYKFTKKQKIKLSRIAQHRTKEHRKKIAEAQKGHICSEETKRKISESHIGKIFTQEHKRNMSIAHIGKQHLKKTKTKISNSLKGRVPWNKGKKKMFIIKKGVINEC